MENFILQDMIVIFSLSIGVLLVCHYFRIPSIVGFLFTGVLCGPHGLGFISGTKDVQTLADIGIVFLLFAVGLEFSLKRLLEHKRFFLLGGTLQVASTIAIGFLLAQILGRPAGESLFLGFLLSLSSTVIVMRLLEKQFEVTTPHGQVCVGILIFQDIAAVPMMLLTPYLTSDHIDFNWDFLLYIGEGLLILTIVFITAVELVPRLMHLIARTRDRDLFILTILTICFTVAWLTASRGLSLPLGAFLAGLIVSETEYRNEAIDDILPFQDVFISVFFVSIGMLLNLDFILQHPFLILAITIGVIVFKCIITTLVTIAIRMPLRTALLTGIALSQVGEFSFVLARSGISAGIASDYHFQLFLSVAVLSMALTPMLIHAAPVIAEKIMQAPFPDSIKSGMASTEEKQHKTLENHVIIVGYGVPGRILSSACKEAFIPYAIIDIDADIVKKERDNGEPIFYGDATHNSILRSVHVKEAQAIAVLTNDPLATLRIVGHVRNLNEDAYIIVRTRWMDEMKPLFQLGADEVVPDEFGASVEIFTRILRKNNVNPDELMRIVAEKRQEEFEMIRQLYKEPTTLMSVAELGVATIKIRANSSLIGLPIKTCGIKEKYRVNPVMISRGDLSIMHLDEHTQVALGDIIVIVGPEENLRRASRELSI